MRPTRGVPLFGAWRSIPLVVAGAFAFAFLSGSCRDELRSRLLA